MIHIELYIRPSLNPFGMFSPGLNLTDISPLVYQFEPRAVSYVRPRSRLVRICFSIDSRVRLSVPFRRFVSIIFLEASGVCLRPFCLSLIFLIALGRRPFTNPDGGFSPTLTNISLMPLFYWVHPVRVFLHFSYFSGVMQSFSFRPYMGLFLPAFLSLNLVAI